MKKNQIFIIELFKKIYEEDKKFVLFLIGDGEQRKCIIDKIKEYGLEKNIILPGIINNINQMYSAFDLFILPSLWEGLPVVSIEAQASGLQTILSDNIDEKAIIDKDKCTMLDLNIEKWKRQILEDKNKKLNRNINMELFINKNLDIKTEVNKIEKIYDEGTN